MKMIQRVTIAPPYSILFLSGPEDFEVPNIPRESKLRVWSTPSCIAVACYPEIDGATEITVGPAREVDPGYAPSFEGTLETPNWSIVVSTAEDEEILKVPVAKRETALRIWQSHPQWPEKVTVGLR